MYNPKTMKKLTSPSATFAALLALLLHASAHADTDCSQRESSRSDPTWSCHKASTWSDTCIPASAFQNWGCLELDANASLCESSEPYHMTVYLAHSGVELDCNGQVIDHAYVDGDARRPGMRTPYSYSVEDISVKNCTIQNTGKYGIDLKRFFRGDELSGAMAGHQHIHITNVAIVDPVQWGIYVGQNSRGVRISSVTIDGAYGGIYLESGSANSRVDKATIVNSREREGIAVDSSFDNVIQRSYFDGNPGGLRMYRNCGETDGQVCPITRPSGANRNLVRDCSFVNDEVRVAARMFKLYAAGFCENLDILGYWYDKSEDNVFDGNRFDGSRLDVNDGPIVVHANEFSHGAMLELGIDEPLLWPGNGVHVTGVVAGNVFGNAAGITVQGPESVERFENRNFAGECEPDNACSYGATTLIGQSVVSMGLWAIL